MVFLFCSTFYFFICVFVHTCIYTLTPWCTLRGERTVHGSHFSPSIMFIPRIRLGFSGSARSTFTFWAILQAPLLFSFTSVIQLSSTASCCLSVFQHHISQVIQCQITYFCPVPRISINSLSKICFLSVFIIATVMGISFAFIVIHNKHSANSFSTLVLMKTFYTQLSMFFI